MGADSTNNICWVQSSKSGSVLPFCINPRGGGNVGINTPTPGYTLDVAGTGRFTGTITSGNTPYKIWLVTGTFPASTGTTTVSLPSGCSPANVISVTGVTNNSGNGDWIPFNYDPADSNWNVAYYIQSANTSVTLVNKGGATQSKQFRVTIMTFA